MERVMQQTTITQLNTQVNDTSILDSKIINLEAQVVCLTSKRNQCSNLPIMGCCGHGTTKCNDQCAMNLVDYAYFF